MSGSLLISATGLLLLYFGAEGLVRGSANLGLRLGLSPLVIGLTIVAFGTSAPELAVSMKAAHIGQSDVSVGNVVGSNIANIGLILGLSALVRPIHIESKLVRIDIPVVIAVSLLFCLLILDGGLSLADGIILLAGILLFLFYNVIKARKARPVVQESFEAGLGILKNSIIRDLLFIVAGLAMLAFGGQYLVDGAVQIARTLGVSEAVIALTIIAIGTSLPELATSVLAAARNFSDISAGNVVGSNIFNILAVLGASAVVAPLSIGNITWLDIGTMLLFSIIILPLSRSGFMLKRWEGLLILCCYLGYIGWLVKTA